MHRSPARIAALGLAGLTAVAALLAWLLWPSPPAPTAADRPGARDGPVAGAGASDGAGAGPRTGPRTGAQPSVESPAKPSDAGPHLALPGPLPALDAAIAPPLPVQAPEPPIRALKPEGQITPSDARHAARTAWQVVHACQQSQGLAPLPGTVTLRFALSGGLEVGQSPLHDPTVALQGVPAAVAGPLGDCITTGLQAARAPVATDCQGLLTVELDLSPP